MASASCSHDLEGEELDFLTSDEEETEFEGFDVDEMPLSFFARGDRERESDSEEDASLFVHDESDGEDSEGESSDEEELVWSENLTLQTDIPFDERCGPVRNLPADKKAIDFFELFFTERLYRLIVRETNRYARQEQQRLGKDLRWRELTIDEFRTWLGLYFAMGLAQKPSISAYWERNKITSTPGFGQTMPRERFGSILRFLHFVDNNSAPPREEDRDRLFKIRPVIEELRRQFQLNYILSREISIDETMVKFKGRKFFRQFLPSKPIRFGFKLFTLAESKSGYIWNFKIYTGRKGEAEENQTKKVVVRLMSPLEDKGYRLFTDNFYSSPDLFFTLREHGIQACGTVRPNRKDLPKEIMDHKLPLVKNLPRGGSLFRKKGELIAATWKDKKPVHLISTVPVGNAMDTAKRKVKENGAWVEKEFQCPAAIKLYNEFMGVVDLADQRIATYKKHLKTSTWYLALFYHCLEQSCLNAFIVEQATPAHVRPKRTQLQFREDLMTQLIGGRSYVKKAGRPSTPVAAEARFDQSQFHHLVKTESKRACVVHVQEVRTVYQCAVCERAMCVEPCFLHYHTLQSFKFNDPTKTRSKSGTKRSRQHVE